MEREEKEEEEVRNAFRESIFTGSGVVNAAVQRKAARRSSAGIG